MRIWARVQEFLAPFQAIARELRVANELKELELEARVIDPKSIPAPLYRVTEKPRASDTEVTFVGEKPKSMFQRAADKLVAEAEQED
jgi:hypothetical protein